MSRVSFAAALLALAAGCGTPQPCPTPLEQCGGQCVDVASDRTHCGTCDTACSPGNVCVQGGCTADPFVPCAQRTGGAFVTLGVCESAVKIWIRDPAFVGSAEARLDVAPDPDFIPSLAVVASVDCDAQWSWHVAPTGASFVPQAAIDPGLACSACPGAIQADVGGWIAARRTWCPAGARVLAVDRRPPP